MDGGPWLLMRVRLQGAAPLGANFVDVLDGLSLRTMNHPEINSNPSRATLPMLILRSENGELLPGILNP